MSENDHIKEKDSGLALLLIFLIAAYITKIESLMIPAFAVLIVTMTVPRLLKPFAFIWFGLANILGHLSSRIVLSVLFILVVIPVSLIKRGFSGDDPLQINGCRKDRSSFKETNHLYVESDLEKPY